MSCLVLTHRTGGFLPFDASLTESHGSGTSVTSASANRRGTKACASRCLVGFLFGGNLRWRSLSPGDLKPPLHELPLLLVLELEKSI
jgi:hypothetical protein